MHRAHLVGHWTRNLLVDGHHLYLLSRLHYRLHYINKVIFCPVLLVAATTMRKTEICLSLAPTITPLRNPSESFFFKYH